LFSERELEADDRGLRVSGPHLEREHRWGEVAETGSDRQRLFFVMEGLVSYVIPKSAFDSPEQAEAFALQTEAWRRAAGSREPPFLHRA
jgi:hypothetical protein